LFVVAIDSEVLFQILIHSFGLTITFWVVSGGEVEFDIQCSSEGPEEVGYKFSYMIGGDMAWNTMLGEDVENE